MFQTTYSQLDDFECEIAPPLNVEPFSCCRVSKPFDRANFPECFPNLPVVTTVLPPVVSESGYDDDDDISDDSSVSPTSGPYSKDDYKYWEWKKDKYHGHYPYKHHHGYDNHRRYHDDYHSDYHRFGHHGGRYNRQTVYRLNQPLAVSSFSPCFYSLRRIIYFQSIIIWSGWIRDIFKSTTFSDS